MKGGKTMDKITVYYFRSANSTYYKANVTTIDTFKRWKSKGDSKAKDVAFIWKGVHPDIKGFERQAYMEKHNVEQLNMFML